MSYQRGADRPSAKLTEQQVRTILARKAEGATLKALAAEYPQVSKVNLHHIIHRRRWKYVSAEIAA